MQLVIAAKASALLSALAQAPLCVLFGPCASLEPVSAASFFSGFFSLEGSSLEDFSFLDTAAGGTGGA